MALPESETKGNGKYDPVFIEERKGINECGL